MSSAAAATCTDELADACGADSYERVWRALEAAPTAATWALFKQWQDSGKSHSALAIKECIGVQELLTNQPSVAALDARRFLRARQHDTRKAIALLAADVAWRKERQPEAVTQADAPIALPTGCWRVMGTSSAGSPILWIQISLWNPGAFSLEEYVSFVIYFLERQAQMGERFIVIFDMAGWKFSYALQLRKTGALIKTLQEHYPERLEAALLFHTPGIFNAAWKLIRPMVDPVTAAKVEFVPSGGEKAALEARGVPSELMPKPYGGPLEVANVPVPNIPGEPNVTVVTQGS